MRSHAILSASGAHRWMRCTPSARLEENFDDSSGEAAAEGTAAHELAEYKLRQAFKQETEKPVSKYDSSEMEAYTDDYVDFVMEQMCKDSIILIEQRLDFSCYVPDGFDTGDCVIVSDGKLHIIDFKYGQGVLVEAEDNPQIKLYALGALELFDNIYDIDVISMTIYQPRRDNVSTYTVSKESLLRWAEEVLKPKADLAFKGSGEYIPGEWCTFCRAAVKCRARAEAKLKLTVHEFALPPLLTDTDIEQILDKLDDLTSWANDIKKYALQAALGGKQWQGWKLISGRSIRQYSDEKAVANAAKKAGYNDIYTQSLLGITAMEKYLGKTKFSEILGSLVLKPAGKPTLTPISDKRPAMNLSAENDFKCMEE